MLNTQRKLLKIIFISYSITIDDGCNITNFIVGPAHHAGKNVIMMLEMVKK